MRPHTQLCVSPRRLTNTLCNSSHRNTIFFSSLVWITHKNIFWKYKMKIFFKRIIILIFKKIYFLIKNFVPFHPLKFVTFSPRKSNQKALSRELVCMLIEFELTKLINSLRSDRIIFLSERSGSFVHATTKVIGE